MKLLQKILILVSLVIGATTTNAQTTPASTDSTNLKAYAGTYTFASGSPLQHYSISVDKGELYGEADNYGKNKLVKQAKTDTYQSTSSYGSVITFVRDAATKAVTSLTMLIQGTEISAKRDNP